jgi:hypothetical protein
VRDGRRLLLLLHSGAAGGQQRAAGNGRYRLPHDSSWRMTHEIGNADNILLSPLASTHRQEEKF